MTCLCVCVCVCVCEGHLSVCVCVRVGGVCVRVNTNSSMGLACRFVSEKKRVCEGLPRVCVREWRTTLVEVLHLHTTTWLMGSSSDYVWIVLSEWR